MTAYDPNGPRSKVMAEAATFKQALLDCLEEHGPQSNADIAKRLGCDVIKVRSRLNRLSDDGLVHSVLVPSIGAPFMAIYHLGMDESKLSKDSSQRTVSKWKPNTIHDPFALPGGFFGAKPQTT